MNMDIYNRAKKAKSSDELLKLAEEINFPMNKRQADLYFKQLHQTFELTDDELELASGGGACGDITGKVDDINLICRNEMFQPKSGVLIAHQGMSCARTCKNCRFLASKKVLSNWKVETIYHCTMED